jgi:NAD(P)-dependent dehydrogenase (short-subunit alcohol dehydrogenase family)
MDLKLAGMRAVVTGGTRGIGRATVEGFVDEGAHVAFCARTADDVAAAEKALSERGGTVFGSAVDVGQADAFTAWVARAGEQLGGIDIVVANISALAIPESEENWQTSFNVDLMHTVRLVTNAMPLLEQSEHGSIVAISSVSGRESDFASGPYGTMKTALVGYIHGLALQLAPKGIRANVVSPGNTFFAGGVWEQIKENMPDLYATALALNPTGRMGAPEESAAAVVFLSSPVASRISGTNLVVDGALTRGVQL